jgi:RNA polymerase sigma-70 factor, ECF subfamily
MNPPIDWDRYGKLLRVLARSLKLDPRLRVRNDESDLAQETLDRAWKDADDCKAETEAGRIAWLHKILQRVFIDKLREGHAAKRDFRREQAALSESSAWVEKILAPDSSPSEQAEKVEKLRRLAEALDELPQDQRDAVIQRYYQGAKVGQIAKELGKNEKAVARLLLRARQKLREYLQDFE